MTVNETNCILFKHFYVIYTNVYWFCMCICPFTYTQDGQTALYIASETDNNECVQLLLKFNANPEIADYVSCDMHFMVYSLNKLIYNIYNVLNNFHQSTKNNNHRK